MSAAAERVGFIGLGIMGGPMARNVLEAGYALTVHDLDEGKVAGLVEAGAVAAADAAAVAERSDIVITSLPGAEAVEAVVTGRRGVLETATDGSALVDTSTNYPPMSKRLASEALARGVSMIDAPVSGGSQGAQEGTLSIMCGGPLETFERCRPVLEAMGSRVTLMSETVGDGGYAKLANQIMVSIHLASVAEAFVFASKAGLDVAKLVGALEAGWANSKVLNVKAPQILARDFSPVGTVAIQHKDLSYVTKSMADLGIELPLSPQIEAMYAELIDRGEGQLDQMALVHLFEEMAGVEVGA